MMLQALIAYAERENLGDADFETVGVRWLIPLDRNGQLAGDPIPLAENPNEKKLRPKAMSRPFTSPNELNQGTKSHFLCDTLERATLFLDPKTPDKAEGRRTQHGYFQSLLEEAALARPDEAARLNAVVTFLRDSAATARLHAALTEAKAKPTDNTTFSVEGVNLLDSPLLKTSGASVARNSPLRAGNESGVSASPPVSLLKHSTPRRRSKEFPADSPPARTSSASIRTHFAPSAWSRRKMPRCRHRRN